MRVTGVTISRDDDPDRDYFVDADMYAYLRQWMSLREIVRLLLSLTPGMYTRLRNIIRANRH